jgi:hypothetical protein
VNGQTKYRLGDVLGLEDECGVVDPVEVDDLMEGTVEPSRLAEIEAHARECPACAELLDDVRQFRKLTESVSTEDLEPLREEGRRSASRFLDRGRARRARWIPLVAAAAAAATALIVMLWPGAQPTPVFDVDVREAVWIDPPAVRSSSPAGIAVREAREAFESGALHRAESILAAVLEENPENVFVLHDLGIVRLERGNAGGAVEALRRADELQAVAPSSETRFWLAVSLSAAGRSELACETMHSAAMIPGSRQTRARSLVEQVCAETEPAR